MSESGSQSMKDVIRDIKNAMLGAENQKQTAPSALDSIDKTVNEVSLTNDFIELDAEMELKEETELKEEMESKEETKNIKQNSVEKETEAAEEIKLKTEQTKIMQKQEPTKAPATQTKVNSQNEEPAQQVAIPSEVNSQNTKPVQQVATQNEPNSQNAKPVQQVATQNEPNSQNAKPVQQSKSAIPNATIKKDQNKKQDSELKTNQNNTQDEGSVTTQETKKSEQAHTAEPKAQALYADDPEKTNCKIDLNVTPKDSNVIEKNNNKRILSEESKEITSKAIHELFLELEKYREMAPPKKTTLEELVTDMIKPELIKWLNKNLPGIVRASVSETIKEIVDDLK